jgi:hypothetical protein
LYDEGHWQKCQTCPRGYLTHRACNQHMNDNDHWAPRYECETCSRSFLSQHSASQHMNALGHWAPKVPCETCNMKFHTQNSADQHMKQKAHYQHYCQSCEQRFNNANSLKMVRYFNITPSWMGIILIVGKHLRSATHIGRHIPCPFCKVPYTTASGLSHHLETGSCPNAPNLNRDKILQIIRQRDANGTITMKQIGWHQEVSVEYRATQQAYNGSAWQCYICHKTFKKVISLNAHLNSPTHKQKIYHCPNLNQKCGKEFVSLAALFGHLESESCGYMRFSNVQQKVDEVLQGRRLIAF